MYFYVDASDPTSVCSEEGIFVLQDSSTDFDGVVYWKEDWQ